MTEYDSGPETIEVFKMDVGVNGQTTIPYNIRTLWGLKKGCTIYVKIMNAVDGKGIQIKEPMPNRQKSQTKNRKATIK